MKYQLILHNGTALTKVLAQSPELPNEASVSGWYGQESPKYEVPQGQQIGIIPEDHAWYVKPVDVIESKVQSFPSPVTEEPKTNVAFVKGPQPSFNSLMADANARWAEEEKAAVEEREALSVVLRNFNRRN